MIFSSSRVFPHNIEAEQGVIGALLVNNKAYENISEFLRAEHFYDLRHQVIYKKIAANIDSGLRVDPILLDLDPAFLSDNPSYLTDLAQSIDTTVTIYSYARFVYDLYLKRQLIEIGENIVQRVYDDTKARDQIVIAEEELFTLANKDVRQTSFVPIERPLKEAIATAALAMSRKSQITGITSGLTDLDKHLGGFHKSDLIIIAGRPSMGKTAFATTIALNCVREWIKSEKKQGGAVGLFSLEMAAEQIATRLISFDSRISTQSIRQGKITSQEYQAFIESSHRLSHMDLYIDDTAGLTLSLLRVRARRLKRKHDIQMLVIDYLQMIQEEQRAFQYNRVQEVSKITRGLKFLAKELEIPVIALSQLNRLVEARDDKRPLLSDLRDSGTIEQDADVVMFVYREFYYLERAEPKPTQGESDESYQKRYAHWQKKCADEHNKAELLIAKNRHGRTGRITLSFDQEVTAFSNYSEDSRAV